MVNETGMFNSESGDRTYNAEDFTGFYADFFTNGIVADNTNYLQVTANNDMNLYVLKGKAYINGCFFKPKTSKEITLPDSDTTYPRYDIVVLRWDKIARDVYLDVISGDSNTNPKYPVLTRNETTYELGLAAVYVAANATSITQDKITDLRFNDDYCGVVTGVINTISTKKLFAQYEAEWDLMRAAMAQDEQAVIAAWSALNTTKTVNGIAPVNGNLTLTQGDVPSGKGAYQMPFKVLKGTVTATSTGDTEVKFSESFSETPTVICTVEQDDYTIAVGYTAFMTFVNPNLFRLFAKKLDSNSPSNVYTKVHWVAFGT
jgi:hypothetical protein